MAILLSHGLGPSSADGRSRSYRGRLATDMTTPRASVIMTTATGTRNSIQNLIARLLAVVAASLAILSDRGLS